MLDQKRVMSDASWSAEFQQKAVLVGNNMFRDSQSCIA
jgi:hypothetical protein